MGLLQAFGMLASVLLQLQHAPWAQAGESGELRGGPSSPQVAHAEDALQAEFTLPAGLEVSLWAASPELYNPTAMDVDARGRIWITEAVNYRKWDGRNPGREHPLGERIVILEDRDGDGRADSSKVFVQDPLIVAPLGICVLGNSVYVSCSPDIIRYTDLDDDDLPDRREVFLTGFGGRDHDHGVHSLVAGPDGYLYGVSGNAGPHLVTDKAGWSLRSGSIYGSGGPHAADNKPGLQSSDGRIWTGGLVFRVRPEGNGLELLAHNFRNPYEVALDSYGNLFTADNDDDGNASCRTLWVMPGGNYGFFSEDGSRTWQADRRPGQDAATAHWHREDPGVTPNGTINGAGAPCGVAVYEGRLLAPWIDGAVLNCDAGAGIVYAHHPKVQGASITLEPGRLIESKDRQDQKKLFRPSDVLVGIDGAVYVADWFDPGVGGHQAADREAFGRILRIAPSAAPMSMEPSGLESPAINVRNPLYWDLPQAARDDLDLGAHPRRAARLVQSQARAAGMQHRILFSKDSSPQLRSAAVGTLSANDPLLARLASDASPMLRRSVANRIEREQEANPEVLRTLLRSFDPDDALELDALGRVFAGQEALQWPALVEEFGDAPMSWSPKFSALAWRLHPPEALEGLRARALHVALDVAERKRALDAIAFMPSAAAAEAMADLALRGPEDLRAYAAWWSGDRHTNDWRAFGQRSAGPGADIAAAERLYQSPLLTGGALEIELDVEGGSILWLVVDDGGNGNTCDWADWIEPRVSIDAGLPGSQGELQLWNSDWLLAEAQWGSVQRNKNAEGGPLQVQGKSVLGIGTHANSRIAFQLPPGSKRLRTRGALDDGGLNQNLMASSVRFEVYLERASSQERMQALALTLGDQDAEFEAREEALIELAGDAEGGMLLLHLARQNELNQDFLKLAADYIFNNPDLSVRALASKAFKRSGAEASIPPVEDFLALTGSPARGQELFFGEAASCSKCHALVRGDARRGLDIGPELTEIRKKYQPAEILDAILNPSAGIAFGYDTWVIQQRGGRILAGFILADGPTLVLKDTLGERHVIESNDVQRRWKQDISSMPGGLAMGLATQDVADIVAFLGEDPGREPIFGEAISLFDGTSLEAWTFYLGDPGARMQDVWSIQAGELVCSGTPAGYLRTKQDFTNFELSLEWRFDPLQGPGNSGVLLRMVGEDKLWPKSIEAQLQHRNAGDIWNIDDFDMDCDPARSSGRHTARRLPSSEHPIGAWNRYVITLDGEELSLEVNGVLQNKARWCEELAGKLCLQSEGAAIRFRNIKLRPILN